MTEDKQPEFVKMSTDEFRESVTKLAADCAQIALEIAAEEDDLDPDEVTETDRFLDCVNLNLEILISIRSSD